MLIFASINPTLPGLFSAVANLGGVDSTPPRDKENGACWTNKIWEALKRYSKKHVCQIWSPKYSYLVRYGLLCFRQWETIGKNGEQWEVTLLSMISSIFQCTSIK